MLRYSALCYNYIIWRVQNNKANNARAKEIDAKMPRKRRHCKKSQKHVCLPRTSFTRVAHYASRSIPIKILFAKFEISRHYVKICTAPQPRREQYQWMPHTTRRSTMIAAAINRESQTSRRITEPFTNTAATKCYVTTTVYNTYAN